MEFRFNVNEVFKQPIVEISSSLIPPGLSLADKRALWDAVGKVSDVVNAMGEASATAQGLTKPITTSERLRNSEHKLYLLIDQNTNNGKGAVTGMLKTGKKGLYVFDRDGHHFQVQPACVLDFYIHESKQRMGLGKKLYEHMLEKEQVEPVKMAIDRPSDKFLGFLNKHYSLNSPVKQMNNFVVYDGFFPEHKDELGENNNTGTGKSSQPANGLQTTFASPYGRYGAPRPPCSMGQIIHNQSALAQPSQEPGGTSLNIRAPTKTRSAYADRPQTNSENNRQISQSTPNMWNQNQNASNAQIQSSQQMGGGYNSQMSPEDMNAQSQSNYVQSQNQQQQYQYQMQQQNMNPQQHNLQRQYQYNQNPYYQNQYTPQMQQNFTPQPYEETQFDASQRNYSENQQQYRQTPPTQAQQYASDKTLNTPATQPGTSDVQLQRKKSVQFTSTAQNIQPEPTQTQSAHDQKYVQRPLSGSQTTPAGNISQQQQSVKYSNERNSNQQYTQQAPYQLQSQQNSQPILNQPQSMRYAQSPAQNLQQPQQSQQTMYQPQQVQQQYRQQPPQMYPPQIHPQQSQQAIYQPQPSQTMTYQSQQLQQAQTQNPITPEESAQRVKFVQGNVSQNVLGNPPGQYNSDTNQNQQNYPSNQQHNINTENSAPGSIAQPLFNVPNNYQMAQPPISNQYPSASVSNIMNYQQPQSPLIQNPQMPTQMHHSQPNIPAPQQMYSQTLQQFDPAVIPPMDAAYNPMNKSYQYYDSNAGRMQNIAGENLKQIIPGTQPAMTPNASGPRIYSQ